MHASIGHNTTDTDDGSHSDTVFEEMCEAAGSGPRRHDGSNPTITTLRLAPVHLLRGCFFASHRTFAV